MPDKELSTYGQQMVSWNPKGYANPQVDEIKSKYAEIIDIMNKVRSESDDGEVKRMSSVAITEAQTASMWAVKAVTWSK